MNFDALGVLAIGQAPDVTGIVGMLTASELAQIRSDVNELMPDTGDVMALTKVADSQGGNSETWAASSSNVACRVDAQAGDEILASDILKPFHRYMLTVPYNTTITVANRFEHGGYTYNIISVNVDQSWIGCKRCVMEMLY